MKNKVRPDAKQTCLTIEIHIIHIFKIKIKLVPTILSGM